MKTDISGEIERLPEIAGDYCFLGFVCRAAEGGSPYYAVALKT